MNPYLESKKEEFEKIKDYFKQDISSLRTGRANSSILNQVVVDAYGAKTPIQGLANIKTEDSRNIIVEPWDKSIIKDIEKAIVDNDLGVSVNDEGGKIRLTFPEMTEENRKDLVKKLNEKLENVRISVRQIRDEIKKEIEAAERDKEITEDDKYNFIEELDKEVGEINDLLKSEKDKKENDIMSI